MNQEKPFKTVEQQIAILKERGLGFYDEPSARRFLLSHNYYSVINGYKKPFLDKDRANQDLEVYAEGTDFLHIEALYVFDLTLRRVTLDALLDVEDAMRTATIYAFCEKHQGRFDYLDPASYCGSNEYRSKKDYSRNLIRLLSTLQAISENRPHKENIGHYLKKYGHVPLWVAAKCLTFGNMSSFYELQKLDVKQRACGYLAEVTGTKVMPGEMRTAYKTLSSFRNICAHEERLYCARVGRNRENSFRELIEKMSLVSSTEDTRDYVERVSASLEFISSKNFPANVSEEVIRAMGIGDGFLDGFIR